METKLKLDAPAQFPFPFEPYPIQEDFMKNLYVALEEGKFGIFESPTGTGKSMSVICGALRWLHDNEQRQKEELELMIQKDEAAKKKSVGSCDDWIADFAAKKQVDDEMEEYKQTLEQRLKKEAKLNDLRNNARPSLTHKRKYSDLDKEFHDLFKDLPKDENSNRLVDDVIDEDKDFVPEDYQSDEEKVKADSESESEDDSEHVTKIYFCSRTHSQLAQFVREVKRSPYADNTRVVTLASRQNTCINKTILKLKSLSLINEKCLEMQKNKTESKGEGGKRRKVDEEAKRKKMMLGKCEFYNQERMLDLRDQMLVEVSDVEETVAMGTRMRACPYYSSRLGVPAAQLVALPYTVLLHEKTREAFGINLKDQIVILDEAHNLVETINGAYSVHVSLAQFTRARSQLTQYMEKYVSRLLAKNLLYVRQILFVLDSCIKFLKPPPGGAPKQNSVKLMTLLDFVNELSIDNINLFKVLKYCKKSQISKKLHGFVEKYRPPLEVKREDSKPKTEPSGLQKYLEELAKKGSGMTETETVDQLKESQAVELKDDVVMSSPLIHIESFLESLTSTDDDGRILVTKQVAENQSSVKFLLMNPAVHFRSVVSEARAVIVAGGTMQPVSEFKDQLCYATGVEPERILEFSCGHVIPPENLLPVALSSGPSGELLDFTYQKRDQAKLLDELGRVIMNVCKIVPGGVVVFFPSYEYENKVVEHWRKCGTLDKISKTKEFFQEPKKSNLCDSVLRNYTVSIQKTGSEGAILLCVVGGKMSEGINFSDDLGRCIVMVGLPYPNRFSPELKEKMDYLTSHYPRSEDGREAGQVHYENLCMKAVNQSIGRAIRHRADYASILLLDQRYLRPQVMGKLPAWIAKHVVKQQKFGPAFAAVAKFFSGKKTAKT